MKLTEVQLVDCGAPARQLSQSVSWNSNGSWLSFASHDKTAKILSFDGGSSAREVFAVAGHNGPLDRVRFHPKEVNILATSAQDKTVRVHDIRVSGTQRSLGRIDLLAPQRYGSYPTSVEWAKGTHLIVTEKDDTIHVYDHRKLDFAMSSRGARNATATPVQSFDLKPHRIDGCQFSPNGQYLVAAATFRGEGMGKLHVWNWSESNNTSSPESPEVPDVVASFSGHTGPIYQFAFSPDGTKLATGGSDALVGLWDVESMICGHTVSRRTKFIRSVSFSHDSKIVASSTEEGGIDLADASNGDLVGVVEIRSGADEISFHPKGHLLACARLDNLRGQLGPPITIAKISMTGR